MGKDGAHYCKAEAMDTDAVIKTMVVPWTGYSYSLTKSVATG